MNAALSHGSNIPINLRETVHIQIKHKSHSPYMNMPLTKTQTPVLWLCKLDHCPYLSGQPLNSVHCFLASLYPSLIRPVTNMKNLINDNLPR